MTQAETNTTSGKMILWHQLAMSFFFFIMPIFFVGCGTAPISYEGRHRDLLRISELQTFGNKFESDRSILWVEQGFLSRKQIEILHKKIDKGISDVEGYLKITFDKSAYGRSKIEYFVYPRGVSHTITGYAPRKYMYPVIFLTRAGKEKAPYLHETVHIITWNWSSLWIKEGLAVYLNDKLGGYPAFPNLGNNLDVMSVNIGNQESEAKEALEPVGKNGIPRLQSRRIRRFFYIFSGSFVKYLDEQIGTKKLMKIYNSDNTEKEILALTGRAGAAWKQDWEKTIGLNK